MKSVYERTKLNITEFDTEDVIATSGSVPPSTEPVTTSTVTENAYGLFSTFNYDQAPGPWF